LLDPYFSATKLKWILDNIEGARANIDNLLFGTIDTFLMWRLTGGVKHVTDATNAARTMLYNIKDGDWDADLLALLDIPRHILPQVLDSSGHFGDTDPAIFGAPVPILGVAGDQQAATVGQACFEPGMMKSTYGTGCFALLNTGDEMVRSSNRLLTTIAYQLDGKPTYALEGSIFIAGAVVQWLRDGLGIIETASQTQSLAQAADPEQKLIMVPAFTGLGAPYWRADCRGAIFGLTRNSGPAEFAKAALESVAFQTRDLVEAMAADWPSPPNTVLRVDGGMTHSDWTMQALSDHLAAPVDIPINQEATVLGVAYLAGRAAGVCGDLAQFSQNWARAKRYEPKMDADTRAASYAAWKDAVGRLMA
jgi:glycerol kinase